MPKKELLDDLFDLSDDIKQTDNGLVRVAYQCPIDVKYREGESEDEALPYTFEDSLALTNLVLFRGYANPVGLLRKLQAALGEDTLEEVANNMFDNLEKGRKAEMALALLYLSEPGQPPRYIDEGLKWLENKLKVRNINVISAKVNDA